MQRVRLLGELGERFGAEYTYYNLRHPADAIKLLCINRPDFKDYLLKADENGIGFKVIQADAEMGYEDLLLPFGQRELVIVPVVTGSGDSFGQILAGIGLIVLSFFTGGATIGLLGLAAPVAVSSVVGGLGASLLIGGVAGLLSPQPQIPTLAGGFAGSRFGSRNRTGGPVSVTRGIDGQQSYAYTGASNTVGIGATVPLAYGKVLIGSHLLRTRVEVTDESDPILATIKKPGPDTFLVGGQKLSNTFSDVSGAVVRRKTPDKTQFSTVGGGKVTNQVKNIPLKPNQKSSLSVNKVNSLKNDFRVAFNVSNGLFAYAGGPGTTFVDAFVTYEVNVYRSLTTETQNLIAVDQVTIQGLLFSPDNFTWMHRIGLPTISNNNITVVVTVIDTDAYSQGIENVGPLYLNLLAIGYSLN